jgi:hypothetical protein
VEHHQGHASASDELTASTLYRHFRWSPDKTERVLNRLRAANLVQVEADLISLTARGETRVKMFRQTQLANETARE